MKLSVNLPIGDPNILTPADPRSGVSMSSKTPGRVLEDRLSLDFFLLLSIKICGGGYFIAIGYPIKSI